MQQFIKTSAIILILYSNISFSGPWFTGPLLAPAGHTVPRGHTNFEFYAIDVKSDGAYNSNGELIHSPLFSSFVANPIITHGFTDWLDVQLTVPYVFNDTMHVQHNGLADTTVSVGLQLVNQNDSTWKPDVRILIQETFPTGSFQDLNPNELGTDSTGLGSYETQVGLNLQLLSSVFETHYLRTRLILTHLFTSAVHVHGVNSYGGTLTTNGRIAAGGENAADLAFEYTLTQHWVAVMEGYIAHGTETRFDGVIEIGDLGGPSAAIGGGPFSEVGLAPALEYNFNSNIGVIGGVWFPVAGSNTAHFMAYTLALNAYW